MAALFALAFLFAQPVVGPEILSAQVNQRNLTLSLAAPAVAMTRDDRGGVVIAWVAAPTNSNALYVARLDATGHVNGAVHVVPTLEDVYAPSITNFNGGFLVTWAELTQGATLAVQDVAYCILDSDLNPGARQLLAAAPVAPPIAFSNGWITANGFLWQFGEVGFLNVISAGVFATDVAATHAFPVMVAEQRTQEFLSCTCPPVGWFSVCPSECSIFHTAVSAQFVSLYTTATSWALAFDTAGRPAVGFDGRDALIAWFDGADAAGGNVYGALVDPADHSPNPPQKKFVLGQFAPNTGVTRPDIATDGNRYVVVWRTQTPSGYFDIVGAVVDSDGTVTPLPIATSSADERDPSVISVGAGKFLVAYEKIENGVRRLAGRFIDFGDRRRAVN